MHSKWFMPLPLAMTHTKRRNIFPHDAFYDTQNASRIFDFARLGGHTDPLIGYGGASIFSPPRRLWCPLTLAVSQSRRLLRFILTPASAAIASAVSLRTKTASWWGQQFHAGVGGNILLASTNTALGENLEPLTFWKKVTPVAGHWIWLLWGTMNEIAVTWCDACITVSGEMNRVTVLC